MIHIFFVPGMFGSTIEYVLRNHTSKFTPISAEILKDGSMHSFMKELHTGTLSELRDKITRTPNASIFTPIYPFLDAHLPEILAEVALFMSANDKFVLVHAPDTRAAELTMLFQYRKIATGSYNMSIDIFCGNNQANIVNWNKDYKSWRDMQSWELREWLSIFYTQWVTEWTNSSSLIDDKFLVISNLSLLNDPARTWRQILSHCGLTESAEVDTFAAKWKAAQQYIVDEFELLDSIIDSTLSQIDFSWGSVSILAEAIIQKRLRDLGYEIKCYNLNKFPNNSKSLYSLLEKC